MSRPLKKPLKKTPPPRFPLQKATSVLRALGSGAKTVVSQHPVMLGLGVMTGCTIIKCLIIAMGPEVAKRAGTQEIHSHLGGLYAGAQGIALATTAVPMVTSIAGAVGGVAGALTSKAAP